MASPGDGQIPRTFSQMLPVQSSHHPKNDGSTEGEQSPFDPRPYHIIHRLPRPRRPRPSGSETHLAADRVVVQSTASSAEAAAVEGATMQSLGSADPHAEDNRIKDMDEGEKIWLADEGNQAFMAAIPDAQATFGTVRAWFRSWFESNEAFTSDVGVDKFVSLLFMDGNLLYRVSAVGLMRYVREQNVHANGNVALYNDDIIRGFIMGVCMARKHHKMSAENIKFGKREKLASEVRNEKRDYKRGFANHLKGLEGRMFEGLAWAPADTDVTDDDDNDDDPSPRFVFGPAGNLLTRPPRRTLRARNRGQVGNRLPLKLVNNDLLVIGPPSNRFVLRLGDYN